MEILTTHTLTRNFNGKTAVADLSIAMTEGGIFGLLGPNGAGKTTTIKNLFCSLEAASGWEPENNGFAVL